MSDEKPTYSVAPEDFGVALDERGLFPLEAARARVRAATAFARGEHHSIPGKKFMPTDSDFLWMALLSLEDADEFTRESLRLDWQFPLRGWDNRDAILRYGAGALPWVEAMLAKGFGHVPPFQKSLEGMLVAAGPEALRIVMRARRTGDADPDGLGLVIDWLKAHGAAAWKALGDAGTAGDPDAKRAIAALGRRNPLSTKSDLGAAIGQTAADALLAAAAGEGAAAGGSRGWKKATALEAGVILRALDAAASAEIGDRVPWPTLRANAGHFEFHAMRIVAVRAAMGDDWGILIEVAQGDILDPETRWPAVVQQYTYGARVTPGGQYLTDARPLEVAHARGSLVKPVAATIDVALATKLDLRPGSSITGCVENWGDVLAIRAAIALARVTVAWHYD